MITLIPQTSDAMAVEVARALVRLHAPPAGVGHLVLAINHL
jgi:hypothetical protein